MAKTRTGIQSLQVRLTMTQTTKETTTTNIINPNLILLETCSTISYTRNKILVQNIQPCDTGEELRAYTNGGHQDYEHTVTLKWFPFWIFKWTIPCKHTFLCRGGVQVRIIINTELNLFINVQLHDGKIIIFKKCREGIYYFDKKNEAFTKDQTTYYTFLNTVNSNKSCFHGQ